METTMIDEPQQEDENERQPTVRQLARRLASASRSSRVEALRPTRVGIAQLTAGLDPDRVQEDSADFRFGAAEALSAVLNALSEQAMSGSTDQLLRKSQRARVLNAIAAHEGSTQTTLGDRLGIKTSNLSTYVRELAQAGLIEPAVPSESHGKAWRLSPWGLEMFFDLLSDRIADKIPSPELREGLDAARGLRAATGAPDPGVSLSAEETYSQLEAAISKKSSEPLRLTTLYDGDLHEAPRLWEMHKRVFEQGELQRPIRWILLDTEHSSSWRRQLIKSAEGKKKLSVWTLRKEQMDKEAAPVQVLDELAVFGPIFPLEAGIVGGRGEALEEWRHLRDEAEPDVEDGEKVPLSS